MVKMKTAKCKTCGGINLVLSGKLAAICHEECTTCRRKREQNAKPAA